MISHPGFDPVLLHLGPIAIRWYGMMYLLSFVIGWPLLKARVRTFMPQVNEEQLADLTLWILFGVVLGGRIGYALFYNGAYYLEHPAAALRIWEGGMSFHGGLIGVLLLGYIFCRRQKISFLAMADVAIPIFPIGLFLGRIGNFINSELWGAPTDLPWGVVFPLAGPLARHPSQLYEAFLEGIVLGAILFWVGRRERTPHGYLLGLFLLVYALSRFAVEFVREPDAHLGYLSLGLTMGQWLCLPMLAIGLALMYWPRPSGATAVQG